MLLEPDGKYQTRAVALDTLMREASDSIAGCFRDRAQQEILQRYGIHDIYRASMEACVRDLGLEPATSARLFGDGLGAAI